VWPLFVESNHDAVPEAYSELSEFNTIILNKEKGLKLNSCPIQKPRHVLVDWRCSRWEAFESFLFCCKGLVIRF
jgi:hypothetical protein